MSKACLSAAVIWPGDWIMKPRAPNASAYFTGSTGPNSMPEGLQSTSTLLTLAIMSLSVNLRILLSAIFRPLYSQCELASD